MKLLLRRLVLALVLSHPDMTTVDAFLSQRSSRHYHYLLTIHNNNDDKNNHCHYRKRRVLLEQAAWSNDWGLNWNRLNINNNNNNVSTTVHRKKSTSPSPPASDDDDEDEDDTTTMQGLERMQTDIGALIEELQNKHNSNGKEAVLQAKLASLSRDLEAYRAASQAQKKKNKKTAKNHGNGDETSTGMNNSQSLNGFATNNKTVNGKSKHHESESLTGMNRPNLSRDEKPESLSLNNNNNIINSDEGETGSKTRRRRKRAKRLGKGLFHKQEEQDESKPIKE